MMVFFKIWPENVNKAFITLQVLTQTTIEIQAKQSQSNFYIVETNNAALLRRFFPILPSSLRKEDRKSGVGKK